MCIVCELREHQEKATRLSVEGIEILGGVAMEMTALVGRLIAAGAKVDASDERAYASAMAVLRGNDPAPGTPTNAKATLREALSKATGVPAENITVFDSPEQAEAWLAAQADKAPTQH